MTLKFFKRRTLKVDPAQLDKQTAEANAYLTENLPKMTFIATWLKNREGQNGFGEDFDITTKHPRRA